jgi:large subunit ribosomal protein LP0
MGGTRAQKAEYFEKIKDLVETYKSCFIVTVDNVGSQQMHLIRKSLRGDAVVLLGKNTMVRRALRQFAADIPELDRLLPLVRGNMGFVFTNNDLKDIRERILANKVAAPARAGALAPLDVYVEAGNTGMDPSKTSFFQALGVPTKIARGTIEIVSQVHLVKAGTKVGASEATLLNMLNISPFTYGMKVVNVYDNGQVFGPEVLDITDDVLIGHFMSAVRNVACISLAANYPTIVSVMHSVINAYKNLLAVSVATEYTFEGSEKVRFASFAKSCTAGLHAGMILHDRKSLIYYEDIFYMTEFAPAVQRPLHCTRFRNNANGNRSRSIWPTLRLSLLLLQLHQSLLQLLLRLHLLLRRKRRTLTARWAWVSLTKSCSPSISSTSRALLCHESTASFP